MKKVYLPFFIFLLILSSTYGQDSKNIFSNEVYSRALNCYLDTILKAYQFDRSEFPKKHRYLKFIVVSDSSISNHLPDTTNYIVWSKVETNRFSKVKNLKRFSKIIFLRQAEVKDELVKVPVLIYYSHHKDSIFYRSIYYFIFKYSCAMEDLILDEIEYGGGIIR